ncbi:hypothetical protein AB1Y20_002125 [Prymnesium parvum]|uniref:Protein kinase domain-containing protein n=1 Tax=Prymnesium parvum TaxID=97485 RepID=A0AB34J884_PRYPA
MGVTPPEGSSSPISEEERVSSASGDESDHEVPSPPLNTGFKLNMAKLQREEIDDAKPIAIPPTPKEAVLQKIRDEAAASAAAAPSALPPAAAGEFAFKMGGGSVGSAEQQQIASLKAMLEASAASEAAREEMSSDSDNSVDEPPPVAATGFKLNIRAVQREEVDGAKPVAVPPTPKEAVMQKLRDEAALREDAAAKEHTRQQGGHLPHPHGHSVDLAFESSSSVLSPSHSRRESPRMSTPTVSTDSPLPGRTIQEMASEKQINLLRNLSAVPVDTNGDGRADAWAIDFDKDGQVDTLIRIAHPTNSAKDPKASKSALAEALAPLEPLEQLPEVDPLSEGAPTAAITMGRSISEFAARCFDPNQVEAASNRLSSLQEWRQHVRWYAKIVQENSRSWALESSLIGNNSSLSLSSRKSSRKSQRKEGSYEDKVGALTRKGSAIASQPFTRDTVSSYSLQRGARAEDVKRTAYLEELRTIDSTLQHMHPCFAYFRDTFSPGQAHPRLKTLHELQGKALAINLELIWHFHLPEAATRLLPRHASVLLPRMIARELRDAFIGPKAAVEAAEKIVKRLGLEHSEPELVLLLLERVQRAAEVWQLKYERWAQQQRDCDGDDQDESSDRPLARTESVVKRVSVDRRQSLDHLSKEGGLPRRSLKRQSKLMRLFGGNSKIHGQELQGKVVAARELALAIRKAQPGLPQTGFDRCKVSNNHHLALAMLEAYSRALAIHAEPAINIYQKITASSSRAKSSGLRAPHAALQLSSNSSGSPNQDKSSRISHLPEIDESPAFAEAATALEGELPKAAKPDEAKRARDAAAANSSTSAHHRTPSTPPTAAELQLPIVPSRRTSGGSTPSDSPRGSARVLTREQERQYKWVVRINEVEMQTRLGAGAYGEVWAGHWRRNEVAVKQLLTGKLTDEDTNHFLQEMQTLAELRHPNIVRFLGACLEPKRMFILFELCPGSLYDLLYKSEAELPEEKYILKLLGEVGLGIYYLHCFEPPMLHLDLKSANVLLDENGVAKVCDFGMSHVMEDAAEAASSDSRAVGSPQWTAPEKLRGEKYDEKADTFSFGMLLYEVMARELPYKGNDSCEIIVGLITQLLPRPTLSEEMKNKWPQQLQDLMVKCYAEKPDDRPAFNVILDEFEKLAPKDKAKTRTSIFAPAVFASPAALRSSQESGVCTSVGSMPESLSSERASVKRASMESGSNRSPDFRQPVMDPAQQAPPPSKIAEEIPVEAKEPEVAIRTSSGAPRAKSAIQHVAEITPDQSEMIDRVGKSWGSHEAPVEQVGRLSSDAPLAMPEAGLSETELARRLRTQQQQLIGIGAPQQLSVRVPNADKGKEGKLVYNITCELDGVVWEVTRKEKDVGELHNALTTLMSFVPDSPIVARAWWRGAEQMGTAAKRLEDYLYELTHNGQWVWDEARVLRQFLQIPITSEKRQARELVLRDIRSHQLRDLRTQLLQEIKAGKRDVLKHSAPAEGATASSSTPRDRARPELVEKARAISREMTEPRIVTAGTTGFGNTPRTGSTGGAGLRNGRGS